MRRLPLRLSLALTLSLGLAGAASAAIQVRIAVRPDTIPLCHPGRVFSAIANTGDQPITARVSLALMRADSVVLGPFGGQLRLGPGERQVREFIFFVPRFARPGPYAWVVRALASDGTSDAARAPFFVTRGTCPPRRPGADPVAELQNSMINGLGLEPDSATPTLRETWGSIKHRYR